MRKFYALFLFVIFGITVGYATTFTTAASGNYDDSNTWGGTAPSDYLESGDNIVVTAGHTLTINLEVIVDGTTVTNNGTIIVNNSIGFYFITSGGLINKGTIIDNGELELYDVTVYEHARNGGVIPSTIGFSANTTLLISGVTSTTPVISSGSSFPKVSINCPSLTTSIDFNHGLTVNGNFDISNTNNGSVKFKSGSNLYNIKANLAIGASGKLILEAGSKTDVVGILSNAGTSASLYLESNNSFTASLIANQDVLGTVERYMGANRWYMVGPATSGSTSNAFNGAYMQYYTENGDAWTYVTETTYPMLKGVGYGYYATSTATPVFTGTIYNSSASFSGFSVTDNGSTGPEGNSGWHVLSNPFSSAITWNQGTWLLNGIDGSAAYYNITNWVPAAPGTVLPANQGFAVRATSGTNSMNIPTDSKLHNAQAFRKAGLNDRSYISLTLIDNIGKTNDLFYLNFDDDASDEYDNGLDAYEFVSGVTAANLSAKLNGDYLSMLGVPLHTGTQVYPLYILKGEDIEYTIGIDELMAIENMEIVLEDIQTGEFITLDESTSYTFIVNEGDDNNRFNLHLKNATAVQDLESELPFAIYSANSSICIMNSESKKYEVLVYDISGRLIYQDSAVSSNFNKIDIDTVEGVYLVKILSEGQAITRKIIK